MYVCMCVTLRNAELGVATYDVRTTDNFQKSLCMLCCTHVHTVGTCMHMPIELLFHVVFLLFCLEVRLDLDGRKKNIFVEQPQRGSRAGRQCEYQCLWPCCVEGQ